VRAGRVLALVGETRALVAAVRDEVVRDPPPVVVTGVLAEQLAKELGAGAAPGAVIVGGAQLPAELSVLVHVIAGDPSEADDELVRQAALRHVDTVIVELWPQKDWTLPFVLSSSSAAPARGSPFARSPAGSPKRYRTARRSRPASPSCPTPYGRVWSRRR
jgi:hypothetical protein